MGNYFGEAALVTDKNLRVARYLYSNLTLSVQAVTDLCVLTLEKNDFMFIFGDGFEG